MAGKNVAVFGIYPHRASCEYALSALKIAGFRDENISILLRKNAGTKGLATQEAAKALEGAAAGEGSGAAIGGALGWLVGSGAIAIPGLAPFFIAGPIVAALAGIGGTAGGLAGALIRLGIPEHEAKRYQGRIESGCILMSVHCESPDWAKKAKNLLSSTGAEDISSTGEFAANYDDADRPGPREPFG
jgi:hypothetical protein